MSDSARKHTQDGEQPMLDLSSTPDPETKKEVGKNHENPEPELVGEVVDEEAGSAIVSADVLADLATAEEIEAAIHRMVARISATKKFKVALLSMTNASDWIAHRAEGEEHGVPYLQESGAEKVVHAFRIEVEHDGGTREEHEDGTYEYVYQGRMRALAFSETWYPIVGSRWSGDGFFSKGGRVRPDPGDVRKAALTSFYNRGIKTVCGLRNLTWDDIEEVPHLRGLREKTRIVDMRSDDRSPGGGSGGGGGKASLHELEKGPHIKVRIRPEDLDNRDRIKALPPPERAWKRDGAYWVIRYSKERLSMILDIQAESGADAVQYEVGNVAREELP